MNDTSKIYGGDWVCQKCGHKNPLRNPFKCNWCNGTSFKKKELKTDDEMIDLIATNVLKLKLCSDDLPYKNYYIKDDYGNEKIRKFDPINNMNDLFMILNLFEEKDLRSRIVYNEEGCRIKWTCILKKTGECKVWESKYSVAHGMDNNMQRAVFKAVLKANGLYK